MIRPLPVMVSLLSAAGAGASTWWLAAEHITSTPARAAAALAAAAVAGVVVWTLARVLHRRSMRQFATLFGAAAAQLGHEDPAVRLAGVYALAAVADEYRDPPRRAQCVNVLCAYLRLPYEPGTATDHLVSRTETTDESGTSVARTFRLRRDDREVRRAVTATLAARLRPDAPVSWSRCDIDLSGAVLEDADFEYAEFAGRHTDFAGARFVGDRRTTFRGARFTGSDLSFRDATFAGPATIFDEARLLSRRTTFDGVGFTAPVTSFSDAVFAGERASFSGTGFLGTQTSFHDARFESAVVSFERAILDGHRVRFGEAEFASARVLFTGVQCLAGTVEFDRARIGAPAHRLRRGGTREIVFEGAGFHGVVSFARTEFAGRSLTFAGADFFGDISFLGTGFDTARTSFDRPKAWVGVRFDWDDTPARRPSGVGPAKWPPQPEST